jgi:hypothetical protein
MLLLFCRKTQWQNSKYNCLALFNILTRNFGRCSRLQFLRSFADAVLRSSFLRK